MTKRITLNLILNSPILLTLRVANLSVSERAEILPDGPKAVFQTVNNPSKQAVIEAFYKNVRTYAFAPDRNLLLTNSARSKRHLSVSNSVRALTRKIYSKGFINFFPNERQPSLRKRLTLRRLMSNIYGAPILDVSRSHTTTQHSR